MTPEVPLRILAVLAMILYALLPLNPSANSLPPPAATPTSTAPTSAAPTSVAPTAAAPTSASPTSAAPTSAAPTSAAPTSAASVPSTPDIVTGPGSRGSRVVIIQRVVHASVEGVYGPKTAAAVKVWQRSHGLPATGVVDSRTWSKINAAWASMEAVGNDISWPQCPKDMGVAGHRGFGLPMPTASAQFVVIGLTNGVGYAANQCLASQVAWAKAHHVHTAAYAITTYPSTSQLETYGLKGPYAGTSAAVRLANAGFAQAGFNVASMRKAGLVSPMVWVDVEPSGTALWTKNSAANKAVVDGVLRGYRTAGFMVGIYSYDPGYGKILGATRYALPEWRTAGPRGQSVARDRCAASYSLQGGPAVLSQWWTASVDHNMTCPSSNTPAVLSTYFHKY
jgi:peptidoglycan hydrolase-like protein with peptidoglycan-binding domain